MRRTALVSVLAIVTALLGAPSHASAAGNSLSDAAASPTAVSPGGLILLSVTYDGTHPATTVTAEVGDLTFPLVRQTGTPTSGSWAAAVTLPVGSWTVVYRASTTQGNAPTLTGPTITVLGAVPPTAMPSLPGGSGPDRTTTKPAPSSSGAPEQPAPEQPAAPAAPRPAPTTAPGSAEPAPAAPVSSLWPAAHPPDDVAAPVEHPSVGGTTAPEPPAVAPARSSATDPVVPSPDEAEAAVPDGLVADDDLPIGIGLLGVAAIGMLGLGLLVAGRPRDAGAPEQPSDEVTAAVLDRRALRQAKVRLEADPIVAALGIEDADEATPPAEAD